MSDIQPTWIGKSIGGRYVIESLLGHGGMSSVYKAVDPNLKRTVAVKIIHPHLSENDEFVKRFEQEATAVARLRHANIMQVHDFNHDGNSYFIIFEYIPGEPLDQRLKALKEAGMKMPFADVLQIMATLCDATAYAHEQSMIHRDLKPSNVILDLLGRPILLDFGIAKIVGGNMVQTATGATMGTAAYMPPEQVTSDHIDHRADIYSLGIMLYEMAAGRPPYEGNSPITVMMKHVQEPLPDISLYNSSLPGTFVAIVERALAKNPDDRYLTAAEMGAALRHVQQQILAMQDTQMTQAVTSSLQPLPTAVVPLQTATPVTALPQPVSIPASAAPTVERPAKSNRSWVIPMVGMGILILIGLAYFFLRGFLLATVTPTSAGMVKIPADTYTVGNGDGGGQYAPQQEVTLSAYWIDRYEVTNADYANFLAENRAELPASWHGEAFFPSGTERLPVRGVTWTTAVDYCEAQGKRLPAEAEWEAAARGPNSQLYPWGDSANSVSLPNSPYAVGTIAANRSPFDVLDMAGNVWEWVDEPYAAVRGSEKIARGGAFDFQKDMAYRLQGDPTIPTMFSTAGIRCAASVVEIVPDEVVLVEDDFTDEASGWPIMDEGSALSGYHPPDFYHVQASEPNRISTAYFGGDFDNIHMEAKVFIDSTDTADGLFRYGLAIRRQGNAFYAFTIAPRSQEWAVLKGTEAGLEVLAQGKSEAMSGLTADTADRLGVDAVGSALSFSINGRLVSQVSDADYAAGDVGFYVETFDESRAHIHYDLIRVEQVPENAP